MKLTKKKYYTFCKMFDWGWDRKKGIKYKLLINEEDKRKMLHDDSLQKLKEKETI